MNNEEIEMSLRTEIENYLKSAFADLRQEIEQMQSNLNEEFERHRRQMDESFTQLLARDIQSVKVDDSFAELVAEHLRIARDEGANSAIEVLASQSDEAVTPAAPTQAAPPSTGLADMRAAIDDISAQTSQAEILKALVRHAGNFAPRGAFFIVKSEHLIGWRVFGAESQGEDSVREIFMPIGNDSFLSTSVKNQAAQTGSSEVNADDEKFLGKLGFSAAKERVAIPLVVRGRGVAALYADSGESGTPVQVEALESLMKVASLTVDLTASHRGSQQPSGQSLSSFNDRAAAKPVPSPEPERVETAPQTVDYGYRSSYNQPVEAQTVEAYAPETNYAQTATAVEEKTYETFSFAGTPAVPSPPETVPVVEQKSTGELPTARFDFQQPAVEEPAKPVETTTGFGASRRFGERNTDLPIDVPEEERRWHNDARRFARLLVSEIKLYNEQKVKEGRDNGDLYERLREAIDRSREMYDKRVNPQVAGKFDYFHFELVNTLAEGSENRLGRSYPGAVV